MYKLIIIIIIIINKQIMIRISIVPYLYAHGALQLNIQDQKFCRLKSTSLIKHK